MHRVRESALTIHLFTAFLFHFRLGMTATIFAFFAGLFAGAFALSCFVIYLNLRNLKEFNAERKRWINKALVREGQATIFPAADIDPATELEPVNPSQPLSILSPLRRGRANLTDATKTERQKEAGSYLPNEVKDRIAQAAAEAKSVA